MNSILNKDNAGDIIKVLVEVYETMYNLRIRSIFKLTSTF